MRGKTIILSMLTAICVTYCAHAAELVIENGGMDYDTDSYQMKVHHSGGEVRPITVQVKNSAVEESGYFSEFFTDEQGDCDLKIPMHSAKNPSGEYIIRLSGADITQPREITFAYVNQVDAEDIIAVIKNNSPGLADHIRENIYGVGLDTAVKEMWDGVSTSGQNAVVNAFAGKTFSNIGEVKDAFSYGICTYRINNAAPAAVEKIVGESAQYLGIDIGETSYFAHLKNKQAVYSALSGKRFPLDKNDKDGVKAAFQTATALAWINEADISNRDRIAEVIKDNNDYLNLPLDGAFAQLSESARKNVLMGILNYRPIANTSALQTAFEKSLRDNTKTENGTGSGSGSSGGGAGSGGGGKVPDVSVPEGTVSQPAVQESTDDFIDIADHWARGYILDFLDKGIVSGTGGGYFSPDRNILREEVVKIIVRAMNIASSNAISVYEDVLADQWYYPYIVTAERNGIVKGVSNTQFGIGQNVSRQDMAVLVSRMLSMNGVALDTEIQTRFADQDSIADYAVGAVSALRNLGIVSGNEQNFFHPQCGATRAEVAKIISEALRLIDNKE